MELNSVQKAILGATYLAESFRNLEEEIDAIPAVIKDEIRTMVDKGWIQVMAYDEGVGDYKRTAFFDTDKLEEYHFMITGSGMDLPHN